ncbi:putative cytochrome c oxidase subunit Vib [Scheffersomyces xylosifermentans]|uniref:putative cytochrome c oxidase subunit Vib n=1 Tax=Scheffersomyces xylosifermentans TaxID=1304137 RepID=UPI00315C94FC
MGFFSRTEEAPKAPPNKAKRKECWDARDKFFDCLLTNNIDNSLDPKELDNVKSKCGALKNDFEGKCVATWVKYFQEKRYNDLTRQRYIEKLESEGAQPLPFKLDNRK